MCNILGNNSLGNVVYDWSGWCEFAILAAAQCGDLLGNNCCLKLMQLTQLLVIEEILSYSNHGMNCFLIIPAYIILLCYSTGIEKALFKLWRWTFWSITEVS